MNFIQNVPKDIIICIGIMLSLPDIISLSLSAKYYNNVLCNNKDLWLSKLFNDYNIKYSNIPPIISPKFYYFYINKLFIDCNTGKSTLDQQLTDEVKNNDITFFFISQRIFNKVELVLKQKQ